MANSRSASVLLTFEDPGLEEAIKRAGMEVCRSTDPLQKSLSRQPCTAVVLGGSPGCLDTIRQIRVRSDPVSIIPILAIIDKGGKNDTPHVDIEVALAVGADSAHYNGEPAKRMAAVIEALIRRNTIREAPVNKVLEYGGVVMKLTEREVWIKGVLVHLTPTGFDILAALMRMPEHVIPNDAIAWRCNVRRRTEREMNPKALGSSVSRLRGKLRRWGFEITAATVEGTRGYVLAAARSSHRKHRL